MISDIKSGELFQSELTWLYKVIETRLSRYFNEKNGAFPAPPSLENAQSNPYVTLVNEQGLTRDERIVLLLALAPYIKPQLLDVFFTQNKDLGRGFSEFGGVQGKAHSGFLPTVETALFLTSGANLKKRFECLSIFEPDHLFFRRHILSLSSVETGEPMTASRIDVNQDFLSRALFGVPSLPRFGPDFPARRIETTQVWDDLVLDPATWEQLKELRAWLNHGERLTDDKELSRKLMPGYRCLFHGPPGTGKTLTVALLGQRAERAVYRIDLSLIISKYIGETEKNLEKVFIQAEDKKWILFFDEADALFGKRTTVSDSHDRFANQETSYLLQRVEVFPGVVILSSNLKSNIDEAFSRRFQSVVHFPTPSSLLRLQLWQNSFSPRSSLEKGIDLSHIAERYELSGGAIMNVVRYCSLMALERGSTTITAEDLEQGIFREYNKEGRSSS